MLHEATAWNGRGGKVPLGVLVLVVVVVIIVLVALLRTGNRSADEAMVAATRDTGAVAAPAAMERPPVLVVTDRLAELIDTARVELEGMPELGPETAAAGARMVEEQWRTWAQHFSQELEAIAALLPELPTESVDRNVALGHRRITQALDELRNLAASGAVPPALERGRRLGIAENHLAAARNYFERAGVL